jgi:putative FmdB family regulatory protein
MPTYEYACSSCGTHIEVYQRFSDEPLSECGVCGGPLRKVFHPAGILFKGSGFYKTDSRTAAKAGEKKEAKPAKAGASAGSGSESAGAGSGSGGESAGAAASSGSGSGSTSTGSSGKEKTA